MAASIGRNLLLKTGSTVIAGLKSKSVSVNKEPVDVTTDDENGFRTLLDDPGVQSLDISFEGVTKDTELRAAIMSGAMTLTGASLQYPNGDTVTGTFMLTQLEETGATADAMNFSGQLQSSGTFTYTAA